MPTGTGRSQPSSTNNAAPGTGEPIGGAPEPAANGALLRREHRCFGRAVDVDHHPPRRPAIDQFGGARLGPDDQCGRLQTLPATALPPLTGFGSIR